MDNNWKQDPRLMAMDPEKVSLLMEFAEKTAHTDQSQLMPHFTAYMPGSKCKRSAIYKF